ncbi:ribbon-helix-helix protein, CopG family [Nonomuraea sp. NPDC005983]|uniref:ribbon-helix-helix protein, CopG family n=1 Tax=Nonomuraea sp. NPDC005983 TaxID=3155595 RepID=UPI0033AD4079
MRRTTVRIDEALLNETKAYAARNGRSLTSVMEDALRQLLNRSTEAADRPRVELPLSGSPDGPKLTLEYIKEMIEQDDIEHYLATCEVRDANA